MKYDRQLLLAGVKRNVVLDLSEIQAYGRDTYGDADYVCIFGMRPADWYAKGIRLLGRTAVECTRDDLADRIGKDVAAVVVTATLPGQPLVIDPFAGSGNTLFWLLRHLPAARGLGFELDPGVFALTRMNLAALALPIEVLNVDYRAGTTNITVARDQLLVTLIAPPWGDALDPLSGLDLRRTYPPISEIANHLLQQFADGRILFVIQVHESVAPVSLAEVTAGFDWSDLKIYDLNAPGQNHGVLLGTAGWSPSSDRMHRVH